MITKVNEAITEWVMNVAKSVLPNVQIPPTSGIGGFMQMLNIDLRTYNIYDELGFLIEPTIQRLAKPMLTKYLSSFSDDEIKELAMMYADAFKKQAHERGYINLFGIELGANAFDGLHDILTKHLR